MALMYKIELKFKDKKQPLFVSEVPADSTPEAVNAVIAIASGCGWDMPVKSAKVLNIFKDVKNGKIT